MRPPSLEAEEDQSGEVGGVGRACDLPVTRLSWLPVGARGKEKPPFERQEALSAAFWVLEAFGSLTFLLLLCWVSMASAPLLPAASLLGTLAILSQGPAFLFTRTFNANLQVLLCQPADEDAENRNALLQGHAEQDVNLHCLSPESFLSSRPPSLILLPVVSV